MSYFRRKICDDLHNDEFPPCKTPTAWFKWSWVSVHG